MTAPLIWAPKHVCIPYPRVCIRPTAGRCERIPALRFSTGRTWPTDLTPVRWCPSGSCARAGCPRRLSHRTRRPVDQRIDGVEPKRLEHVRSEQCVVTHAQQPVRIQAPAADRATGPAPEHEQTQSSPSRSRRCVPREPAWHARLRGGSWRVAFNCTADIALALHRLSPRSARQKPHAKGQRRVPSETSVHACSSWSCMAASALANWGSPRPFSQPGSSILSRWKRRALAISASEEARQDDRIAGAALEGLMYGIDIAGEPLGRAWPMFPGI